MQKYLKIDIKISVSNKDSYERKRFTAAHELGHFIYHRSLIGDGLDDNIAYRSTNFGNFYNTNIKKHHETQANKFAAALLMPEDEVFDDYSKLGNIEEVAKKWKVSSLAMKIRLGVAD